MGGAFVSIAIAVYVDTFQGDDIPERWALLLGSSSLFGLSGVAWIALSMSLEDLEKSIAHLPSSLTRAARSDYVAKLQDESAKRFHFLLWFGLIAGACSLVLFPLRSMA